MASIGGPVQECSIKGRLFSPAADGEVSIKSGGFENAVEPNGDATVRIVKSRVPWMAKGLNLAIDHNRADMEFLQGIADGMEQVTIAITLVDGTVFQGKGTINGELDLNTAKATCPVELSGGGKMEQQ